MLTRSNKDHDFTRTTLRVVEQAVGERFDGTPLENHSAAVALYFMRYNFGRVHLTLKTTPAVKAGVADHIWTVEEIVALMDSN